MNDSQPALGALLTVLRESASFGSFGGAAGHVTAPTAAAPALVALSLAGSGDGAERGTPTVVVTATGRDAEAFAEALGAYLDPDRIAVFPAWETLPHERLSPRPDTIARRVSTLRRLADPTAAEAEAGLPPLAVVVAPIRAVIQPFAAGLAGIVPVSARVGQRRDLTALAADLVRLGYVRVDMVEGRGEFAVRGGIIDVFVPIDPHPVRIEMLGDEVESVRAFAIADQRSLGEVAGLWAPPCREVIMTADVRARAAALVDTIPAAASLLARIAEGVAVEGMESLLPVLVPDLTTLAAQLPLGTVVIEIEPERLARREEDLVRTAGEFLAAAWATASDGGRAPVDLSAGAFHRLDDERAASEARGATWGSIGPFGASGAVSTGFVEAAAATQPARVLDDVGKRLAEGWSVLVLAGGPGSAQRLVERCGEVDIPARVQERYESIKGVASVVPGVAGGGWVAPAARLAVYSESDFTGRAATVSQAGKVPSRRRSVVDPLALRPGDHVVHDQHGVGRFVELARRQVRGVEREYLVIEYAPSRRGLPGDRLSVPTDHLDRVSKYVGGEVPALSKMGGADWAKTKGKARRAVRDIASELIRLYSARMATAGHACGPDTPWQRELEEAFPYVETPDQLVTIDEVKADMEKPIPMDRLICGDVGFGKTEIAIRAAFKAVQDGGQVAVLCPTTLLVKQHVDTFSGRLAQFPVKVAALSRFQTDAEAREVAEGLAAGTVDIVIGTHRMLTGQFRFKRLGLVIVDEEQRFGVEHKETLKAMRTNVDVLAMSATPIPRTLEMAVTGIRELSTLATPPEERLPILTYVGPHEEPQVAAAIRRELLRDGQVFLIHNSVATIDATAAKIRDLVPEARVAVAHGQMGEHDLERVIVDYYEKRSDVLVCTTIVETGLDIPNANTLIVERADGFGLSQLHQLRGRVGRGRERAYAYFLYPAGKAMTETAHDRLQTIASQTDLGAGTAVAMKDLEIRGAGNLLGGEQSGHIEGVGFDLYMRMVGEAVADFRGETPDEAPPGTIDLPIDAHIPAEYIAHERLRLEAYRRLADARTAEDLAQVQEEFRDRYGELPEPVANLVAVAQLRLELNAAGIGDVVTQGRYVRFSPVELADSAALRIRRVYPGTIIKPAVRQVLVSLPASGATAGAGFSGLAALEWVRTVITVVSGR